jgi:hypothetical protein
MTAITNARARHNPLRLGFILLLLLASDAECAKAQPGHRMHELARAHEQESTPKVYYRPFCRRSHYVTNPSAPCWN